jgi:hypothetical protein
MCASDGGNGGHQFTKEFGSVIQVQNVRGAAAKVEFVEEARYQGGGFTKSS